MGVHVTDSQEQDTVLLGDGHAIDGWKNTLYVFLNSQLLVINTVSTHSLTDAL